MSVRQIQPHAGFRPRAVSRYSRYEMRPALAHMSRHRPSPRPRRLLGWVGSTMNKHETWDRGPEQKTQQRIAPDVGTVHQMPRIDRHLSYRVEA